MGFSKKGSQALLDEKIESIRLQFRDGLNGASTSREVEDLRVHFLGRKGPVVSLMQDLKDVSREDRPRFGKLINDLKGSLTDEIEEALTSQAGKELDEKISQESIDVSLPGREHFLGRMHPISQSIERIVEVMTQMGFSVYYTPEIESEYNNYGGLNYPEDHPARDMQDTYYIDKETLLRSHTTNFQQRVMANYKPPIRRMAIGKCYRNETISARSHVIFHQIDVMYIDKGVTLGDLLASLEEFYTKLFEQDIELRVRGSYFPFVEPGVEVDVKCTICKGNGCRLCKQTGWLEMGGAGMVHPEVLKEGGLNPDEYSGFAWGGGVERPFMLMHGVDDIRLFLENDMRFLEQFP